MIEKNLTLEYSRPSPKPRHMEEIAKKCRPRKTQEKKKKIELVLTWESSSVFSVSGSLTPSKIVSVPTGENLENSFRIFSNYSPFGKLCPKHLTSMHIGQISPLLNFPRPLEISLH